MEIRLATPEDCAPMWEIYAPFCDTPVSFEASAPSVEEMRRRLRTTLERLPWLACAAEGMVVGYAYAGPHRQREAYRWSVEVSAYVRDGWRGQGIGKALYTSLLEILRLQGFQNAYAGITLPNPASVGLHEALGFRPVGVYHGVGYKCGAWRDVGWWEFALRDHPVEPSPPQDILLIRRSPGWVPALSKGLAHLRSPEPVDRDRGSRSPGDRSGPQGDRDDGDGDGAGRVLR